jgi:molecular chaperone DnaK
VHSAPQAASGAASGGGGDNIVDAEFTEIDDDKKPN